MLIASNLIINKQQQKTNRRRWNETILHILNYNAGENKVFNGVTVEKSLAQLYFSLFFILFFNFIRREEKSMLTPEQRKL